MNDYTFGNFLYSLRIEKGLSQVQLGEMLGVTNKAVSKWETGTTKPSTDLLPKIADIFGVTVEELFAARRLERDTELANIKMYLISQKRRYAVLTSAFLAVSCMLPFLLIEFVGIVETWQFSDEVAGPLAVLFFMVAFIASLVSCIVYRHSFHTTLVVEGELCSDTLARRIKRGKLTLGMVCGSWLLLFLITAVIGFAVPDKTQVLWILCAVLIWGFILILGSTIFLERVKRLLNIKSEKNTAPQPKRIRFSELPRREKIWCIGMFVLALIFFGLRLINSSNLLWRIITDVAAWIFYFTGWGLLKRGKNFLKPDGKE
ncbi:MAG: helix-turn-helix transcriptional regulator [Lachnospiraceae bacterium]|nr:helix-turn-helix transcriptional regulator [Lachnospiraceae bacterium]